MSKDYDVIVRGGSPGEHCGGALAEGSLRNTIQPFPTFSEIYLAALKTLQQKITEAREPIGAVTEELP